MARHLQLDDEQFSAGEARRRFPAAVNAGLNTKPKPLKSIAPKAVATPAQRRRKSAS